MLQSPNFLFRVENPDRTPRGRRYEAASRLSYFLWDTMPDAALFRRRQRRTEHPRASRRQPAACWPIRARTARGRVRSEWLRFDRVLTAVKDRRAFPQFTPELAHAMTEETRRLIADPVWNDRNFIDIFTADYAFVNADLARVYSVPAPPEEFEQCRFPRIPIAPGITGAGAVPRRSPASPTRPRPPRAASSCASSSSASTCPIRRPA